MARRARRGNRGGSAGREKTVFVRSPTIKSLSSFPEGESRYICTFGSRFRSSPRSRRILCFSSRARARRRRDVSGPSLSCGEQPLYGGLNGAGFPGNCEAASDRSGVTPAGAVSARALERFGGRIDGAIEGSAWAGIPVSVTGPQLNFTSRDDARDFRPRSGIVCRRRGTTTFEGRFHGVSRDGRPARSRMARLGDDREELFGVPLRRDSAIRISNTPVGSVDTFSRPLSKPEKCVRDNPLQPRLPRRPLPAVAPTQTPIPRGPASDPVPSDARAPRARYRGAAMLMMRGN